MKDEILKQLAVAFLTGQDFVSGAVLGEALGVSRMAVSKSIQTLTAAGWPIESVKHHGYRLMRFPDLMQESLLAAAFAACHWKDHPPLPHAFDQVDSTNLAARRGSDQGDPSFSVYVAEEQTAGRGRRGKNWRSPAGEGLWFSLMIKPDIPPERLAPITLFAGLCVATALRGSLGLDIELKWPNDLVLMPSGKKLGGILTEMMFEENQVSAVVVGIGINVHTMTFPEELKPIATSLNLAIEAADSIRGENQSDQNLLNRITLLTAILAEWDRRWPHFLSGPLEKWLTEYRTICATLGRMVEVHAATGDAWTGQAEAIASGGDLIVLRSDGTSETVSAGDVSVRGLLGFV